jgi:hypothetical protein
LKLVTIILKVNVVAAATGSISLGKKSWIIQWINKLRLTYSATNLFLGYKNYSIILSGRWSNLIQQKSNFF